MMDLAVKKGIGATGIILIILVSSFFFTMFYIVLYQFYMNQLPNFATSADTLTYKQSTLDPLMNLIPWLFLLSIVLYGVIQVQNPISTGTFAIVWAVVLFAYVAMSMFVVILDGWMMVDLPAMLPMEASYSDYYTNAWMPLWRGAPLAVSLVIFLYGLYFATTFYEQSGRTYRGGMF